MNKIKQWIIRERFVLALLALIATLGPAYSTKVLLLYYLNITLVVLLLRKLIKNNKQ